ncbi:DUF4149 domain-containing protein [bacterium]|nr:DUF4149 domain-containing protein [bacterium]
MFFSFVFAPRVFSVLEKSDAARLQNALFYPYYFSLCVCAALVILACFQLGRFMKFGAGLAFLNLAGFLLGYFYLTPTINTLFLSSDSAEHMKLLHQGSILLSLFSLVSGIFLLFSYLKSIRSNEI